MHAPLAPSRAPCVDCVNVFLYIDHEERTAMDADGAGPQEASEDDDSDGDTSEPVDVDVDPADAPDVQPVDLGSADSDDEMPEPEPEPARTKADAVFFNDGSMQLGSLLWTETFESSGDGELIMFVTEVKTLDGCLGKGLQKELWLQACSRCQRRGVEKIFMIVRLSPDTLEARGMYSSYTFGIEGDPSKHPYTIDQVDYPEFYSSDHWVTCDFKQELRTSSETTAVRRSRSTYYPPEQVMLSTTVIKLSERLTRGEYVPRSDIFIHHAPSFQNSCGNPRCCRGPVCAGMWFEQEAHRDIVKHHSATDKLKLRHVQPIAGEVEFSYAFMPTQADATVADSAGATGADVAGAHVNGADANGADATDANGADATDANATDARPQRRVRRQAAATAPATATATATATAPTPTLELNSLKVAELKAILDTMGMTTNGKRHELVQRIETARRANAQTPEDGDAAEILLWDARLGRTETDGDGFWQENTDLPSPTDAPPPKWHGFTHLIDADGMLAVRHWRGNVVLPGSNSQHVMAIITADAFTAKNMPQNTTHATTSHLRWVAAGWRGTGHTTTWKAAGGEVIASTTDGDRACRHLLKTAMNQAEAVNLGMAFCGDNYNYSSNFIGPYLTDSKQREEKDPRSGEIRGSRVCFTSHLPPVLINLPRKDGEGVRELIPGFTGKRQGEGKKSRRKVYTLMSVESLWIDIEDRAIVNADCKLLVHHVLTGDGAFLLYGDQISINAALNDPDSNASKKEQQEVCEVVVLELGDTFAGVADKRCSDPGYLEDSQRCNTVDVEENRRLQHMTREPETASGLNSGRPRTNPGTAPAQATEEADRVQTEQAQEVRNDQVQAQPVQGSTKRKAPSRRGGATKRTAGAMPAEAAPVTKEVRRRAALSRDPIAPANEPKWANPHLRGVYNHETFFPKPIDANAPVTSRTLVRMMIVPPKFGERNLPGLWKDVQLNKERKGKCIMHGAMCSGVNNLQYATQAIIDAFENNTGNERDLVQRFYNEPLTEMGLGELALKINADAKPPKIYKQSLNGSAVTRLHEDGMLMRDLDLDSLPVGGVYTSKVLEITRKMLIRLDRRDALQELHRFAKMFKEWSLAMHHGYKMKPTDSDREQFVEHARRYVFLKAFYFGHLIWYDWQLYYTFPFLIYWFGALRFIDQEPIEGRQKMNAEMFKKSFRFANVRLILHLPLISGRIDLTVHSPCCIARWDAPPMSSGLRARKLSKSTKQIRRQRKRAKSNGSLITCWFKH